MAFPSRGVWRIPMIAFNKQIGLVVGRILLSGVFLLSGFLKVSQPLDFADRIYSFQILPEVAIHTVALGLPILELVIGVLILIPRFSGPALMTYCCLLALFSAGLLQGLIRGLEINCGCFGRLDFMDSSPEISLLRNAGLMIMALWIYKKTLISR